MPWSTKKPAAADIAPDWLNRTASGSCRSLPIKAMRG